MLASEFCLVSCFDCKDHFSSCFCYSCELHLKSAVWLHIKALVFDYIACITQIKETCGLDKIK